MPTPPEMVESLRNNPDPDAKVLFHSAQVGSGLTKLHRPDFVFYFPNDTAAKAVEWKLSKDDFEVAIEPPDENYEGYLVVANTSIVPTLEAINSLSDQFHELAEELEGEYDGWGAEAVE